jgi:hypothetical protein
VQSHNQITTNARRRFSVFLALELERLSGFEKQIWKYAAGAGSSAQAIAVRAGNGCRSKNGVPRAALRRKMSATIDSVFSPEQKVKAYVWSFPGGPVHVHLNLEVVRQLAENLKREAEISSGGSRCGILLGLNRPGGLEISDFSPLETTAIPELETTLARAKSIRDITPVGYYRVQNEDRLCLSAEDLSLVHKFFSDPGNVVLLISRADDTKPPTAGFFFWDEGTMNGDFCFLDFPFDAALLAELEEGKARTGNSSGADTPPVAQTLTLDLPATKGSVLSRAKSSRAWRVCKISLSAALISLAGFTAGIFLSQAVRTNPDKLHPIPLILNVHHQGADLAVTWDHNSLAVTTARSGLLKFYDGASIRELPMDKAHLLSGSAVYTPTSDNVRVQLDLDAPDNTTTSQSVTVILPAPAVTPAEPQHAPAVRSPLRSAAKPPETVATNSIKSFQPPAEQATARPTPDSDILAPPAILNNSPSANGTPFSAPVIQPPKVPPTAAALPAPVAQSAGNQAETSSPSTKPTVNITQAEDYIPPEPLKRVWPLPLTMAQRALLPGGVVHVEIKVFIDEQGKVRKAEAVSHASPILVTAASSAARMWVFRPSQKKGRNVPGEMILQFNFDLGKR